MEKAISKLLKTGVLLSSLFLLIGVVLLMLEPSHSDNIVSNEYVKTISIKQLLIDIVSLKSAAFFFLGVLTLLLTPIARIILSFLLFIKIKNIHFVIICGITLLFIIVSILINTIA